MRILLVEDDPMIGESLADVLRADGYAADWARDAGSADTALRTHDYDLVLLDLGLPDRDGLAVLRDLRARKQHVPVLIATARDAVAQRILGLDAGADDYMVKPFDPSELLARMRALLRRGAGAGDHAFEQDGVRIDTARRQASVDGRDVVLTAREWAVLAALLARPGAILSRAQLEEKLYGWNEEISSNTVEVHIHALRRKLGAGLIQTVRGMGYVVPRPCA